MKLALLPIACLAFVSLNAQNLVPNSSFEEHDLCPRTYNQLRVATPWFRPSEGTSDYFNACDTFHVGTQINAGVPNNFFGYQQAHTGQAYAGICLNSSSSSYREYLEVKLTEPLQHGIKYTVSFYYSAADSAKMAVKSLGAFFSDDSLLQNGYKNFPVDPQVSYDGNFITDSGHWKLFRKSFIASGGENYLTLGNFKNQVQTDVTYVSNNLSDATDIAYVYIDDISVSASDISAIESTQGRQGSDIFYLQPNLTMGEVAMVYYPQVENSEMTFKVFNLFGHEIYQSTLQAGTTILQTGSWSAGYYFFEANNGSLQKTGKFLLVK